MSDLALLAAGMAALTAAWALSRIWRGWRARRQDDRDRRATLVVDPLTGIARRQCPACGAGFVHRSRARGPFERLSRDRGSRRIFRCDACPWRGWLEVLDNGAGAAVAPSRVDLRALDADGARTSRDKRKRPVIGDLD